MKQKILDFLGVTMIFLVGFIYFYLFTWQYPLVYVSIDYKIRKDKKMSNIHNERILEELFDKHLEIVERDFDLPEEVQERIAIARAKAEWEEME